MTAKELSSEELSERLDYKNACIIGRYLQGTNFQGERFIIQKLKEVPK